MLLLLRRQLLVPLLLRRLPLLLVQLLLRQLQQLLAGCFFLYLLLRLLPKPSGPTMPDSKLPRGCWGGGGGGGEEAGGGGGITCHRCSPARSARAEHAGRLPEA